MCKMCRGVFIIAETQEENKNYEIVLNSIFNSHEWNNDGYFIEFDNNFIRTLDFKEFMNFIYKFENEIRNSKCIHLHLRQSTNYISKKWIHGWKFGTFRCSHNGIINKDSNSKYSKNIKEHDNDSYTLFSYLFMDNDNLCEEKLKKSVSDKFLGYGGFIINSMKDKICYLIAKRNKFYVKNIGNCLVFGTQSDVFDRNDIVYFEDKEKFKKYGVLKLKKETIKEIELNLDFENVFKTEFDNQIIRISYKDGIEIEKISDVENISYIVSNYSYNKNKKKKKKKSLKNDNSDYWDKFDKYNSWDY